MTEPKHKIIGYLTREDLTKRTGPVTLYDVQGDDDDVPVVAPWGIIGGTEDQPSEEDYRRAAEADFQNHVSYLRRAREWE